MCLILVAWQRHRDFPLVVAANRDEFHARPTAGATFWQDDPSILAGRDLECMGTWLGVTRNGKFAAVSNYRDAADDSGGSLSRGLLASTYLGNGDAARKFVAQVAANGEAYRGFNFLAADHSELWWVSNRAAAPQRLAPGVYGVSNHLLDTPWSKVVRGKRLLGSLLQSAPAVEPLPPPY